MLIGHRGTRLSMPPLWRRHRQKWHDLPPPPTLFFEALFAPGAYPTVTGMNWQTLRHLDARLRSRPWPPGRITTQNWDPANEHRHSYHPAEFGSQEEGVVWIRQGLLARCGPSCRKPLLLFNPVVRTLFL